MVSGLIKPDAGIVTVRGRVGALIALGAGFNPILTGRENILANAAILGLSHREAQDRMHEIIDFAEIGDALDAPLRTYSSGMVTRLGFAVASTLNPDILILDEVLAVGDQRFQAKCMMRISSLLERCGVIFVSHQANLIQRICDSVVWLKNGSVWRSGPTNELLHAYQSERQEGYGAETIPPMLHPDVAQCVASGPTTPVRSGDDLAIDISMTGRAPVTLTALYVFLHNSAGVAVARATVPCEIQTKAGVPSSFRAVVRDVRLRTDNYRVEILLMAQDEKIRLAQCHLSSRVRIESSVMTVVDYQPQGYVELEPDRDYLP
jgi:lipopolysaccharide transport system ATP-binding protein